MKQKQSRDIRRELAAWFAILLVSLLATASCLGVAYSAATLEKDALSFSNACELREREPVSTAPMEGKDPEAARAEFDGRMDGEPDQAEAQSADGRLQPDEGRQELEEKREELEDGRRRLAERKQELEDSRAQLEDTRRELDESWEAVREEEDRLRDVREELDRGGAVLTESEYRGDGAGMPGVLGDRQEKEDGMRAYYEDRDLWYARGEEYLDALTLYEKNLKQIEREEADYAEALAQVEEGEQRLADGERQLAEDENALLDAQEQLRNEERFTDGEEEPREKQTVGDELPEIRGTERDKRSDPGFVYAEENAKKLSSKVMKLCALSLIALALAVYAAVRMAALRRIRPK